MRVEENDKKNSLTRVLSLQNDDVNEDAIDFIVAQLHWYEHQHHIADWRPRLHIFTHKQTGHSLSLLLLANCNFTEKYSHSLSHLFTIRY